VVQDHLAASATIATASKTSTTAAAQCALLHLASEPYGVPMRHVHEFCASYKLAQ
jgi:hypothetical protein